MSKLQEAAKLEKLSLEMYNRLSPYEQGYATYMLAERPGYGYLPKTNPYERGSRAARAWDSGAQAAVISAQDTEED
jgi:hypothetical protein